MRFGPQPCRRHCSAQIRKQACTSLPRRHASSRGSQSIVRRSDRNQVKVRISEGLVIESLDSAHREPDIPHREKRVTNRLLDVVGGDRQKGGLYRWSFHRVFLENCPGTGRIHRAIDRSTGQRLPLLNRKPCAEKRKFKSCQLIRRIGTTVKQPTDIWLFELTLMKSMSGTFLCKGVGEMTCISYLGSRRCR